MPVRNNYSYGNDLYIKTEKCMKSYISLCFLLSITLNSMDAPKPLECKPLTMDQWEFFSETNDLDRMGPAIPFWDNKKDLPIESIAHLHILEHSNLSEKKSIFNTEYGKRDISYFLATKADHVVVNARDMEETIDTITKFKHPNLTFSPFFHIYKYDLIVSCHPIAEKQLLAQLTSLLNPRGEIFCLFNTQSNKKPVLLQAFENMDAVLKERFPLIQYNLFCSTAKEVFPRPTDNLLKGMIAELNLETLKYAPKTFDVLIMKKQHKKFLATCKASFVALLTIKLHADIKKVKKSANEFIENIVKIIKKDDSGNWIYPFDFTVVHVKQK